MLQHGIVLFITAFVAGVLKATAKLLNVPVVDSVALFIGCTGFGALVAIYGMIGIAWLVFRDSDDIYKVPWWPTMLALALVSVSVGAILCWIILQAGSYLRLLAGFATLIGYMLFSIGLFMSLDWPISALRKAKRGK